MANVPGTRCPLRLRLCQLPGLEQHGHWLKIKKKILKKMFILYLQFLEAGEHGLVFEV